MNKPLNRSFLMNALTRTMSTLFPGYFGGDTKHQNFYRDYGYPEHIAFENYYQMWKRNGIARAGVNHAIESCWQEYPLLQEKTDTHDITDLEQLIIDHFEEIGFWSALADADKYSRIGEYGAVIFRFRDSLQFDQPVARVSGGIVALAEAIPVLQGQLKPMEFYTDATDFENYGKVKMFTFSESWAATDSGESSKVRTFNVHPDRVHIWSHDSSIYGEPILEAGYNDLITIQKVIGAGGEGFWKNAKAAPVLEIDTNANLHQLAQMLGVDGIANIPDKLDEVIGDYQKGYDQMLMLQGMTAKPINVSLPDPQPFFLVACQSFAASVKEPLKMLIGSQSGERASTEDAKEWNKTCNSRRTNYIKPNINRVIKKLVKFGILPSQKWFLLWSDLTESTGDEKAVTAVKMAEINNKMQAIDTVFDPDEIRETMGWQKRENVVPRRSKQPIEETD